MIQIPYVFKSLFGTAGMSLLFVGGTPIATADVPCGDLDECVVRIEINATDGDIGFHVLFDAEGWKEARIIDPDGKTIFKEQVNAGLQEQKLTENFFESSEPVCEEALAEDEDDEVVTLPEFLERFVAGLYNFRIKSIGDGELAGATSLTHTIPAAPADVDFDGSVISWTYGNDLGACTTLPEDFALAGVGDILGYEVVLEPDDDAVSSYKFTVQVPGSVNSITVPAEHLASLPLNTPLKVEVGAIERRPNGSFGNQTFSEEDGFCSNSNQELCPEANGAALGIQSAMTSGSQDAESASGGIGSTDIWALLVMGVLPLARRFRQIFC